MNKMLTDVGGTRLPRREPRTCRQLFRHLHDCRRRGKWMTEAAAQAKVTEAGYTVTSIKTDPRRQLLSRPT